MRRLIKISLIILLYVLLGFSREYLFESINIKLYYLWHQEYDTIMEEALAFMNDWDYWTLYWLKWILTGVFSLLYLGVGLLIIKFFFPVKHYRSVIFSYALVVGLSALVFALGYVFDSVHSNYAISRQLMDWLQSPVIMLFLVPGIYFMDRR